MSSNHGRLCCWIIVSWIQQPDKYFSLLRTHLYIYELSSMCCKQKDRCWIRWVARLNTVPCGSYTPRAFPNQRTFTSARQVAGWDFGILDHWTKGRQSEADDFGLYGRRQVLTIVVHFLLSAPRRSNSPPAGSSLSNGDTRTIRLLIKLSPGSHYS